jgi:hypothetical protein
MDGGNSDIISLRRLVKDIRRHFALFTRENYLCFDGLPYGYEAVQLDGARRHGSLLGSNIRTRCTRHLADGA